MAREGRSGSNLYDQPYAIRFGARSVIHTTLDVQFFEAIALYHCTSLIVKLSHPSSKFPLVGAAYNGNVNYKLLLRQKWLESVEAFRLLKIYKSVILILFLHNCILIRSFTEPFSTAGD